MDVDALLTMQAPAIEWKQTVYMLIDPAAGGPHSDFALVSFLRNKGQVTVRIVRLLCIQSSHYAERWGRP